VAARFNIWCRFLVLSDHLTKGTSSQSNGSIAPIVTKRACLMETDRDDQTPLNSYLTRSAELKTNISTRLLMRKRNFYVALFHSLNRNIRYGLKFTQLIQQLQRCTVHNFSLRSTWWWGQHSRYSSMWQRGWCRLQWWSRKHRGRVLDGNTQNLICLHSSLGYKHGRSTHYLQHKILTTIEGSMV
jgi:hypothetical protein